ncbi:MAG: hypothetical protein RJA07_1133 [Bacteroidota bacterium]
MLIVIICCHTIKAQEVNYQPHLYSHEALSEYMPDTRKEVGVLPGTATVDLAGNANYSIPIELPVGTKALVPNLSINYNSANGSDIVGHGWSIGGLSQIIRVGRDIYHDGIALGPKYLKNSQANFTNFNGDEFALNGERLVQINNATPATGGVAHYETENQSFTDIYYTFATQVWTVVSLDGTKMEFGSNDNVFHSNFYYGNYNSLNNTTTNGSPHTLVPIILFWRVNKITDPSGNFIEFYYQAPTITDRTPLVTKIKYTGFGQENNLVLPNNEINFIYKERFDKNKFYHRDAPNQSWQQDYLLTDIQINSDGNCFKKYNFVYSKDLLYSYLIEVAENTCANSENGAVGKNSTKFIYNDADLSGSSYNTNIAMNSTFSFTNSMEVYSADIDGDGRSEVLTSDFKRDALDIVYNQEDYLINDGINFIFQHHAGDAGSDGDVDFVEEYNTNIKILKSTSLSNFNQTGTITFPTNSRIAGMGDFDGDGRQDILVYQQVNSGSLTGLYIYYGNNSTSMNMVNQVLPPNTTGYGSPMLNRTFNHMFDFDNRVRNYICHSFIIGDFDGDGRSEFITILSDKKSYLTKPGTSVINSLIDASAIPAPTTNMGFLDFYSDDVITITDMNGDNKSEIHKSNQGYTKYFHISLVFNSSTNNYEFINSSNELNFSPTPPQFYLTGDFNGDGKTDFYDSGNYFSNKVAQVHYSFGMDLELGKTFPNVPQEYLQNKSEMIGSPADYNGDGKTDFFDVNSLNQAVVYFSNGIDFKGVTSNLLPYDLGKGFANEQFFTVGDFNGDGKQDILRFNLAQDKHKLITKNAEITSLFTTYSASNTFIVDYFGAGNKERLLNTVVNGLGSEVKFSYENLTIGPNFYTPGNYNGAGGNQTDYPVHTTQSPKYCVSTFQTSNGLGSYNATTFTYVNNQIHLGGKGGLGFEKVISRDHATNLETISEYRLSGSPYFENNLYGVFKSNFVANQNTSATYYTYGITPLTSNNSIHPHIWTKTISVTESNLLSGASTTTTNHTFDATSGIAIHTSQSINGIITTQSNITLGSFGAYSPLGISTSRNNKALTITSTATRTGKAPYTTNTTNTYNYNGLPLSSITTSGSYTITKNFDYTLRGNLKQTITNSGNNTMVNDFVFENQHNPVSNNDYFERFLVAKSSTGTNNGSTDKVDETYDYGASLGTIFTMYGIPQSITKADGLTSSFAYDDFGRLTTATDALGNSITTTYNWSIAGFNRYKIISISPISPDVANTIDYIGRTVHTESEGFNNQLIYSDKSFYANGLTLTETNMHTSSETPITSSYIYDNYNRVTQITTPASSVTYNYLYGSGTDIVQSYDANNSLIKSIETDATGAVVKETDNGGNITSEYNSLGAKDATKLNGTTVTTYNYDANTGFLISKNDINSGLATYQYDEFGKTIQETDANSNTKTYTYDGLGRLLTQTIPEGMITYNYSSHTNAFGKPVTLLDGITGYNGNDISYIYDGYNRIIEKTNIINGNPRTNRFHYDAVGHADGMEYPTGFAVGNQFDNNGYLTKVTSIGSYTAPNNVLQVIYENKTMNGQGQPLTYTMGNGQHSQIDYQYNIPTRLLTSSSIQDLNLTYDYNTGNLLQRDDRIKSMHEDFTYDNLQRLTQAQIFMSSNTTGLTPQQVNYDAFSRGNIVNKSDVGNYYYSTNHYNAVDYVQNPTTQNAPATIPTFNQNIQYTSFDAPSVITENVAAPIAAYQMMIDYAADGSRVKSTLNDNAGNILEERTYLGNFETYYNANQNMDVSINYISGGNGLCAILLEDNNTGNQDLLYVYKDQQGSILTLTDAQGNKVYEQNYDAWGRERNAQNWTYTSNASHWNGNFSWLNRGYTGHEHLKQFGLINMNGRMYDPVLGRMLSPDEYNQGGTQGLNAYSYCINNPLKFTDPSGWSAVGHGNGFAPPVSFWGWGPSGSTSASEAGDSPYEPHGGSGGATNFLVTSSVDASGHHISVHLTDKEIYEPSGDQFLNWRIATAQRGDRKSNINPTGKKYFLMYNPGRDGNLPGGKTKDEKGNTVYHVNAERPYWEVMEGNYTYQGQANWFFGAAASTIEFGSGISRIGSNGTIYVARQGGGVFYGNQYVSTFSLSKAGNLLGKISVGIGVFLDYRALQNNEISPEKFELNTAMGAYGLWINPIAPTLYFGIDAFYPGGWNGAMQDQSRLNIENSFNPYWQLWPGAMKQ